MMKGPAPTGEVFEQLTTFAATTGARNTMINAAKAPVMDSFRFLFMIPIANV
jgi:hypothetical protein